ncbi:MAG: SET domain-containing protein [Blastocatellia bacterium]
MNKTEAGTTSVSRKKKAARCSPPVRYITALTTGLEARPSPLHGLGCFATQPFRKGRKIAEYGGAVVRYDNLTEEESRWDFNHIVGLDDEWVIDGNRGGNLTKYINHSCDANMYMRVTRGHAIFYALRDIAPGEELTWAYYIMDDDGRIDPCPCEKSAS